MNEQLLKELDDAHRILSIARGHDKPTLYSRAAAAIRALMKEYDEG